MKISGFTFVRNAHKFDYPVVEAIHSILPLCDEVVVAVGNSEDETLALIQSIDSPKIKIIETIWDDSMRKDGIVLAMETDKALAAVSKEADWCFYIQGDEVIHEQYLPIIRQAMEDNLHKPEVEGLLFKYQHFYGSYRYVGDAHWWYRREIRVIRNTGNVASYKDAQGFRTLDNHKLNVKLIDAYVYHYGWVKPPEKQKEKIKDFNKYWHDGEELAGIQAKAHTFDYSQVDSLAAFTGTHPQVMQARIARMDWLFDFDIQEKKLSLKHRLKLWFEQRTGKRFGEYRNYRIV